MSPESNGVENSVQRATFINIGERSYTKFLDLGWHQGGRCDDPYFFGAENL